MMNYSIELNNWNDKFLRFYSWDNTMWKNTIEKQL